MASHMVKWFHTLEPPHAGAPCPEGPTTLPQLAQTVNQATQQQVLRLAGTPEAPMGSSQPVQEREIANRHNVRVLCHDKAVPWPSLNGRPQHIATNQLPFLQRMQLTAGLLAVMREAEWVPNVFTYSAAIHACGMARWQLALGLLTAMLEADLAPDALTCSVAINA